MIKRRRVVAVLLTAMMLLPQAVSVETVLAAEEPKTLDVMFVHDTHSHLNTFTTVTEDGTAEVGGFSRIKTLIDEQKAKNPDTLLLDGGDFSMGTLVQTIFEEEAAELRMLGELGFEVTTLGNHEFDYRSKGLANMFKNAVETGENVPELLVCNIDWETMESAGLNEGQQMLYDAFEEYGAKDYVVIEKGDVDIAVIGVFGKDALECAPTCELIFKDPVEAVKETVAEIQANEDVDMIACVSHSGTWEDESKSEDEILAKEVPELDLIISGHTHSSLYEPIVHGDTYIVSAGEYGKNLGSLTMEQKADGRWTMTAYELIPITTDILQDEETQARVDAFMDAVDTGYMADFGYTRDQVLAQNDSVEFTALDDMGTVHTEQNLGSIMSDAFVYAVENAEGYDGHPVDVAVVPSGCVRDTFGMGDITAESVFNSYSLGIGVDGVPGYPMLSVYLTGKELATVAEIDASVSDFMTAARLYNSGLNFTFNPNRLILNKVTDVYLVGADGGRVELEDDKLYRVVADLYSGQMLGAVTDVSYGILSIVPKYADGTPIEDLEDAIIMDGDRELKAWDAIAQYMQSLPDTDGDGIANIPVSYSEAQGRKVVDDSKNIIDLIKNPNKYAAAIVAIIVILILLVVLIVRLVVKLVKRIRGQKAKR